MRARLIIAAAFMALALVFITLPAQAASAKRGALLAKAQCGACHATGRSGASPNLKAPTFRRIARQWPLDQLQEALGEGIVTGHPGMPEFAFEPRQIDDLLAHLARLKRR